MISTAIQQLVNYGLDTGLIRVNGTLDGKDVASNEKIEKHAQWVKEFLPKYDHLDKDNIEEVLHKEVGNVFVHVLEDAGVYKCTGEGRAAFMRFIENL